MKYRQTDSGLLIPCDEKTASLDGLVNVASSLGTSKSKRSASKWQYDCTNWAELDAMYQSNWIARAIVDEWATDMVREWRSIKSGNAEQIEAEENRLSLKQHCEEAISWARLYGGAGVVMITNQDLEQPLDVNKIKKGDLEKLLVFDRYDLTAYGNINTWDLLADNYMRPEFYVLSGGSQRIHHSHIAFFNGARLPKRQARINFGWGDSELRRCIEEINDMVASKGGIAELMQEANIDVITRDGLTNELSTDQDDAIIQRYEMFSLMKSVINMALLDGDEKLDRQTLNLGGVAPVLDTFMIWIAGAARMPMTKIFGTSASGLNATGEGDAKNYYEAIRSQQNSDFTMSLRKIDEVMVRSAVGSFPVDFDYVWNPLQQLNEIEVAQAQLLQAQKSQIYLESSVIQRSQVMRNLQSNEEYQYNDDEISKLEILEESTLFDEVDEPEDDNEEVVVNDGWITSNGAKILLNSKGEIEAGMGSENKGKTMSEAVKKEEKPMSKTEEMKKKLEETKAKRVALEKEVSQRQSNIKNLKSEIAKTKAANPAEKVKELEKRISEVNKRTAKLDKNNSKNDN